MLRLAGVKRDGLLLVEVGNSAYLKLVDEHGKS
jgi:hypothetical protein